MAKHDMDGRPVFSHSRESQARSKILQWCYRRGSRLQWPGQWSGTRVGKVVCSKYQNRVQSRFWRGSCLGRYSHWLLASRSRKEHWLRVKWGLGQRWSLVEIHWDLRFGLSCFGLGIGWRYTYSKDRWRLKGLLRGNRRQRRFPLSRWVRSRSIRHRRWTYRRWFCCSCVFGGFFLNRLERFWDGCWDIWRLLGRARWFLFRRWCSLRKWEKRFDTRYCWSRFGRKCFQLGGKLEGQWRLKLRRKGIRLFWIRKCRHRWAWVGDMSWRSWRGCRL